MLLHRESICDSRATIQSNYQSNGTPGLMLRPAQTTHLDCRPGLVTLSLEPTDWKDAREDESDIGALQHPPRGVRDLGARRHAGAKEEEPRTGEGDSMSI